jgi:uncharacterized membrane protein YfcA
MLVQDVLGVLSGTLVGFVLGLIGGGGSVLSIPLLVYVVGVRSPHVAIGTSAIAVALSALSSLIGHARAGNVRWPCAIVFTAFGMAGAAFGSTLGKQFDGQRLLTLFGILMVVIAALMLRRRDGQGSTFAPLSRATGRRMLPRLAAYGAGTGLLSGFFGIGGGFLIVPGLIAAVDLPLLSAVGSSLVAVTAFGATTAASYALSGLVDWRIVATFVAGGALGSLFGGRVAGHLAGRKQLLSRVFATIVAATGLYVAGRGLGKLL